MVYDYSYNQLWCSRLIHSRLAFTKKDGTIIGTVLFLPVDIQKRMHGIAIFRVYKTVVWTIIHVVKI